MSAHTTSAEFQKLQTEVEALGALLQSGAPTAERQALQKMMVMVFGLTRDMKGHDDATQLHHADAAKHDRDAKEHNGDARAAKGQWFWKTLAGAALGVLVTSTFESLKGDAAVGGVVTATADLVTNVGKAVANGSEWAGSVSFFALFLLLTAGCVALMFAISFVWKVGKWALSKFAHKPAPDKHRTGNYRAAAKKLGQPLTPEEMVERAARRLRSRGYGKIADEAVGKAD